MALSSFSLTASVFLILVHVPWARIKHAFVNMNTDAIHPTRGASEEDIQNQLREKAPSPTVIDYLWNDPSNKNLVHKFLNNNFCTTCANSTNEVCLPLYRKYLVQNYFFQEDYIKYKAKRLITLPMGDLHALHDEAASILGDVNDANDTRQFYLKQMKGSVTDLAEDKRSVAELAYGNVLQNPGSQNDWFDMHVLIIPCIYGWYKLAEKLQEDKSTKNDTIFYDHWIKQNIDPSYFIKLNNTLEASRTLWTANIDTEGRWQTLFRTALKLEIALFKGAYDN